MGFLVKLRGLSGEDFLVLVFLIERCRPTWKVTASVAQFDLDIGISYR